MEAGFPKRFRNLREEHGLSRKELGDILGVSTVAVFHWEKGVRRPKRAHLEAASVFFGIPANYLATGRFGVQNAPEERRQALEEYLIEVKARVAKIADIEPTSVLISVDILKDYG